MVLGHSLPKVGVIGSCLLTFAVRKLCHSEVLWISTEAILNILKISNASPELQLETGSSQCPEQRQRNRNPTQRASPNDSNFFLLCLRSRNRRLWEALCCVVLVTYAVMWKYKCINIISKSKRNETWKLGLLYDVLQGCQYHPTTQ